MCSLEATSFMASQLRAISLTTLVIRPLLKIEDQILNKLLMKVPDHLCKLDVVRFQV